MNLNAITKAESRLRLATQQLESCSNAANHNDFADAWYLFLVAAKNVLTTLEQGAKSSAQSRQWFGAKKQERKDDPLLQYLFQARNDEEHGLADVTKLKAGYFAIGGFDPSGESSSAVSFSMKSDEVGNLRG